MTNVGEVTGSRTPSPAPMPWVSAVFPARAARRGPRGRRRAAVRRGRGPAPGVSAGVGSTCSCFTTTSPATALRSASSAARGPRSARSGSPPRGGRWPTPPARRPWVRPRRGPRPARCAGRGTTSPTTAPAPRPPGGRAARAAGAASRCTGRPRAPSACGCPAGRHFTTLSTAACAGRARPRRAAGRAAPRTGRRTGGPVSSSVAPGASPTSDERPPGRRHVADDDVLPGRGQLGAGDAGAGDVGQRGPVGRGGGDAGDLVGGGVRPGRTEGGHRRTLTEPGASVGRPAWDRCAPGSRHAGEAQAVGSHTAWAPVTSTTSPASPAGRTAWSTTALVALVAVRTCSTGTSPRAAGHGRTSPAGTRWRRPSWTPSAPPGTAASTPIRWRRGSTTSGCSTSAGRLHRAGLLGHRRGSAACCRPPRRPGADPRRADGSCTPRPRATGHAWAPRPWRWRCTVRQGWPDQRPASPRSS